MILLIEVQKLLPELVLNIDSRCFAEEVKLLKDIAKRLRNCDDVYSEGHRSSRIYNIFTGKRIVEAFCELEQVGNNWLVSISHSNANMK